VQKTYAVELAGATALLMHADNLTWAETMKRWELDPENKKLSVKGDDRSPAWRWLGSMYHDGKLVGIPSDNLMTTIREGASRVDTGKRGATFKRQSQSGIVVNEILWPIVTPKGTVSWAEVAKLRTEEDFSVHEETAGRLGFELFPKRARIGQAKHVRVRPRFSSWSASGTVTVFDESITGQVLEMIWTNAGRNAGLGDWRPSSPKSPGPWGTFTAKVREVK
jgi:hypothetical protein